MIHCIAKIRIILNKRTPTLEPKRAFIDVELIAILIRAGCKKGVVISA